MTQLKFTVDKSSQTCLHVKEWCKSVSMPLSEDTKWPIFALFLLPQGNYREITVFADLADDFFILVAVLLLPTHAFITTSALVPNTGRLTVHTMG